MMEMEKSISQTREANFPDLEAKTIPGLLQVRVKQFGGRTFFRQKHKGVWQRFTYDQVYACVKKFALGLAKLGLQSGQTVAISGENAKELFWAEYGVLALGGKTVCLYPDMLPSEIKYILQHSEASFFVAEDQEQVDKILAIRDELPLIQKIIYWDSKGMWQYDDPMLMNFTELLEVGQGFARENPEFFETSIEKVTKDDIAVISYTSGTTGLPKGVILTHANLLDNAYRVAMSVEFKPFSQYLSYISPAWGTEQICGVTLGLVVPFELNFPEKPETVLENIRELGAEILVFGPRQWESLVSMVQAHMLDAGPVRRRIYEVGMKVGKEVARERTEGQKINPIWKVLFPLSDVVVLKAIRDNLGLKKAYVTVSGGTAMSPDIFRFFHAIGIKLRNLYGTTETGILTQHLGNCFAPETMGKWFRSHPDFGPPLEWKLKDSGELLARGGAGFAGYYKNSEMTKAKLEDGWFLTGDAVTMKENGELVFLDRVSDLRRLSDGHMFPPQFIETRLRFSPYIRDAIALGDASKPFVSALINIDFDNVSRWAERQGITYATLPDLSQKREVIELIEGAVAHVNQLLEPKSQVKRFVNLPKELDPDEAELTRTRKLRREFIEDRYKGLIRAIYEGESEFCFELQIKYRDGRSGYVKNNTRINFCQGGEVQ